VPVDFQTVVDAALGAVVARNPSPNSADVVVERVAVPAGAVALARWKKPDLEAVLAKAGVVLRVEVVARRENAARADAPRRGAVAARTGTTRQGTEAVLAKMDAGLRAAAAAAHKTVPGAPSEAGQLLVPDCMANRIAIPADPSRADSGGASGQVGGIPWKNAVHSRAWGVPVVAFGKRPVAATSECHCAVPVEILSDAGLASAAGPGRGWGAALEMATHLPASSRRSPHFPQ
jgi:hypothetical protein